MAQSIRNVEQRVLSPAEQQAQSLSTVLASIAENSEGVLEFVKLVSLLHQKGLLKMGTALLEQSDEILQIVVDQAGKPGYAQGLKNVISCVQMFSSIDHNTLQSVSDGMQKLTKLAGREPERIHGVLDLWRTLRDPDFAAGLGLMVQTVKVVGEQLHPATSGVTPRANETVSSALSDGEEHHK